MNIRKKKTKNVCPKCGSSNVIPIIYGLPSYEAFLESKEGKIKLGGCIVSDDNPNWHCKDCGHEW
jgi:predicted RNA-binding Zn-ribbon protein involved in translation (DUF1610 family)